MTSRATTRSTWVADRRAGLVRPAGVAICVLAVSALSVLAIGPSFAAPVGPTALEHWSEPAQAVSSGVQIELIDERYSFGPDESLHLVYRLSGDLASLELTAPAATTTIPETTVPATTIPEATVPDNGVGATTPVTSVADTTVPETTVPIPLTPLTIEVANYPPLVTPALFGRADIDDLVGGDVDRDAFGRAVDGVQIVDARSAIVLAADGTATLTLDVPTDVDNSVEERLKFDRPGLYPIRTELLTGDPALGDVVATHGTFVQRLPGPTDAGIEPPPINLAVVTALPAATPETDAADVAAKLEAFELAVDTAAAVASPMTMSIPPPIVAAAASTPDGGAHLATSLADDEFVALPAMPLDVSSAVAAGKDAEFARELGAGEDILTAAVPTTASSRNVWIATEPLSGSGAQELRDLGFRYLVMPEQLYTDTVAPNLPETDLFVEVMLPGGGTLPLIVLDRLSEQLTIPAADRILSNSTAVEWAVRSVTGMLQEQAAATDPRLQRSRVLSTPDLLAPDARLLIGLETLLATTPSVVITSAATLTGQTDLQSDPDNSRQPVQVELPTEAGPSLDQRVALIDATALSAASAGTMLPADDPRPTEWAAQLDALISTALSDEQVAVVTSGIQGEADAIRGSIVPPDPFTFTLTGRTGDIEMQLGNTSDDVLTVLLRASSPKLSFPASTEPAVGPPDPDAGDHLVTLRPNDETSIIVPVRAKSNGTSPITVQLLTPFGEVVTEPVTVTATVTAFTGLGQALTAGFVIVLLTWWAAHWRKRRRAAVTEVRDRHPSGAQ
jgi:hypothetical protein